MLNKFNISSKKTKDSTTHFCVWKDCYNRSQGKIILHILSEWLNTFLSLKILGVIWWNLLRLHHQKREETYTAFENIYPVLTEFRKIQQQQYVCFQLSFIICVSCNIPFNSINGLLWYKQRLWIKSKRNKTCSHLDCHELEISVVASGLSLIPIENQKM